MTFRDRLTTRKGEIGERIMERILRERGYEVFRPSDLANGHRIDGIAIKRNNPKQAIICDAKAKPARVNHADTGIDLEHWRGYKALAEAHNMRAILFFVDEDEGTVRANFLDVLDQRHWHKSSKTGRLVRPAYPLVENTVDDEIRYYELVDLPIRARLEPQEIAELRGLSTRDSKYQAIAEKRLQEARLL